MICIELEVPPVNIPNQGSGTTQDQSMLHKFRELQKRQVEFIKKRVMLLEKGLYAELQEESYASPFEFSSIADEETNNMPNVETGHKVTDVKYPTSRVSYAQINNQLPQVEIISAEEILAFAVDKNQDRLNMPRLYNEMSKLVVDNAQDSVEAYIAKRSTSLKLGRNLGGLEAFNQEINHILSSPTGKPNDSSANGTGDVEMEEKMSTLDEKGSKKSAEGVILLD
ncbi:hypothetical protein RD792_001789 [Penstemon davidsonii]|uniref:Uncharacterized protein n=1 Tax=Penstemon davidsonii TaxID=160366 RepID=A0ABR0DPA6_9LAMI|nr:hypothetical protein RD792_001789 [Penstemon davidsonii]